MITLTPVECDELQRIIYSWFEYRKHEKVRPDIKKILEKIGIKFTIST